MGTLIHICMFELPIIKKSELDFIRNSLVSNSLINDSLGFSKSDADPCLSQLFRQGVGWLRNRDWQWKTRGLFGEWSSIRSKSQGLRRDQKSGRAMFRCQKITAAKDDVLFCIT